MMTCGTSVDEARTKSVCSMRYSRPSAMRMMKGRNGTARNISRIRAFIAIKRYLKRRATSRCRSSGLVPHVRPADALRNERQQFFALHRFHHDGDWRGREFVDDLHLRASAA